MLTHTGTTTLETERLTLRRFELSDTDSVFKNWANDPAIQTMVSEPVYSTPEAVQDLLGKYIDSYSNPDCYRWAICLKETDECIGQIAFFLVNSTHHFSEIEYCIGQAFQKKGLATEALKAIIEFGFESVNFHKIQVCHKAGNEASMNLIRKCQFTYEGTLRDFFYMNGKYVDRLYYSMLRSEYEQINR